jgi:hypothetical protein
MRYVVEIDLDGILDKYDDDELIGRRIGSIDVDVYIDELNVSDYLYQIDQNDLWEYIVGELNVSDYLYQIDQNDLLEYLIDEHRRGPFSDFDFDKLKSILCNEENK